VGQPKNPLFSRALPAIYIFLRVNECFSAKHFGFSRPAAASPPWQAVNEKAKCLGVTET